MPFLALALVDTEGGDDIHINDELVERGYAEFTAADSENEWTDESDEEVVETTPTKEVSKGMLI